MASPLVFSRCRLLGNVASPSFFSPSTLTDTHQPGKMSFEAQSIGNKQKRNRKHWRTRRWFAGKGNDPSGGVWSAGTRQNENRRASAGEKKTGPSEAVARRRFRAPALFRLGRRGARPWPAGVAARRLRGRAAAEFDGRGRWSVGRRRDGRPPPDRWATSENPTAEVQTKRRREMAGRSRRRCPVARQRVDSSKIRVSLRPVSSRLANNLDIATTEILARVSSENIFIGPLSRVPFFLPQ